MQQNFNNFNDFDIYSDSREVFENEPDIIAHKALWRGVITQALMDAASNSKKRSEIANKKAALEWLRGDSEDFLNVCHMADMDPEYVKQQTLDALSRGCKWRNDARKAIAIRMNLEREERGATGVFICEEQKNAIVPNDYCEYDRDDVYNVHENTQEKEIEDIKIDVAKVDLCAMSARLNAYAKN